MKHLLTLLLTLSLTMPAWTQSAPTISNVRYQVDPQHNAGSWGDLTTLSNDRQTLTTTLPPASALDRDLNVIVEVTYDPRVAPWYPPVTAVPTNYGDGLVQMTSQGNTVSNGVRTIVLTAKKGKLANLTEQRAYRVNFDPGNGQELVWAFEPYEGPNYVANIAVSPGSPRPGDLVEFEITLSEPVESRGGQRIAWRLTPANFFVGTRGNTAYDPNTLNWVTIPMGQQLTRLTVRVNPSADAGATARIETWPEEEQLTMTPPAYQSRTFRLGRPPRR